MNVDLLAVAGRKRLAELEKEWLHTYFEHEDCKIVGERIGDYRIRRKHNILYKDINIFNGEEGYWARGLQNFLWKSRWREGQKTLDRRMTDYMAEGW
jgi:hypothetical protein